MGVEYCHYLIPRPNSFRPTAEQLLELIGEWEKDHWIAAPGTDAFKKLVAIESRLYESPQYNWAQLRLPQQSRKIRMPAAIPYPITVEWLKEQLTGESRFEFPVEHADQIGLQYPLENYSGIPDDPYYEIEIHLSHDYVHHSSECIEPVPTRCRCGEELEYYPDDDADVFFASRIRTQCPKCSRAFDPSKCFVSCRDGFTGDWSELQGGAAYRFAIVIDCGKCFPRPFEPPLVVSPRLLDLCQRVLKTDFYQVGDFY